jgi:hypothetical protein
VVTASVVVGLCLAAVCAACAAATVEPTAFVKHRTRTVLAAPTLGDTDSRQVYSGRVAFASSGRVELESRSLASPTWRPFAVENVAANGSFAYTADMPGSGTYWIKAVYLGDSTHLPSSGVVSFQVI